jgi:hypothetical protein
VPTGGFARCLREALLGVYGRLCSVSTGGFARCLREALLGVYGGFANHEWQYVIAQIALVDCHGS